MVCIFLFAANNFAVAPLAAWGPAPAAIQLPLMLACIGAIGTEAALLAIWCVLGPIGIGRRLTAGVAAGLVLVGAWTLGFALFSGRGDLPRETWDLGAMFQILLCLPLLFIAIQVPLWAARYWFKWRVMLPADQSQQVLGLSFGVRELLVATCVVALSLAAVRLVAPFKLASIGVASLIIAFFSLFTTVPVTVAALRARRIWLALCGLLLLDLVITAGAIVLYAYLAPEAPHLWWQHYVGLAAMAGMFFASLTGVMLLVRKTGLRLFWGRHQLDDVRSTS